jgi:DNA primase
MKFSPEFIQRVQEASNLVDIISQHTTLKPAGGGLMGRCPFPDHPEKTPSFSVSETKQVYNCFGCHKKGNIFTFLEQYNGMSFPEAVEYLAGRANIAMPAIDKEHSEKLDKLAVKRRQILNLNRLTMQFFYDQFQLLPSQHPAKIYAEKRGLDQSIIQTFKIGYAPAEWDSLLQYLTKKEISLELMEEAKLIKARSNGTGYFDLFRDRLIFPIFDTKNEVIAFGGRILGAGDVKYLNSPETLVFSKSKTLYGLSETSKFIRSEDQVVVVEGYMDLIALYQVGICNVVAPMGTALTHEQSRMLRRQTQNVVVLFDGDEAGQNAAEKSLPILLEADIHPKGLILADEMDPDEFVKEKGAEALRSLIQKSPDLFPMILGRWMKDYRGEASEKVQIVDRLKPLFMAMVDPRLRDLYLAEVSQKLSLDARWLKSAIGNDGVKNSASSVTKLSDRTRGDVPPLEVKSVEKSSMPDKIQLKGATPAESMLMAVALKNRANFQELLDSEVLEKVLHPGVKKVLERAAGVYRQDPSRFDTLTSLLTTFVDEPEKLFFEMESSGPEELQSKESRLLQDCAMRVRERHLKYQAHLIGQELKSSPSIDGQIDVGRLERIMNLQRDRLSLRRSNDRKEDGKDSDKLSDKKEDDSEFK